MRSRRALPLAGAVIVVLAVFALVPLFGAIGRAKQARAGLLRAQSLVDRGDRAGASSALDAASRDARAAAARLGSPATALFSHIPIAGRPVRAARGLSEAAAGAASAARDALTLLPDRSPWSRGAVDIEALGRLRADAQKVSTKVATALRQAKTTPDWPLPGVLASTRIDLIKRLEATQGALVAGDRTLEILPAVLGQSEARRYIILAQNPAELRGTGGQWSNYALVEAEAGALRMTGTGRTFNDLTLDPSLKGPEWYEQRYAAFYASTDWRLINMAPDLPTVAGMIESRPLPKVGSTDGLIVIDPIGLAAILRLTGPVTVDGWPDPIGEDNVVAVTLVDFYEHFETDDQARVSFLGVVTRAVWQKLLTSDIPLRPGLLGRLGAAITEGHLQFHMRRSPEQRVIAELDADGALGPPTGTVGLVTNNASGAHADTWLERELDLAVGLQPDGSAEVLAKVTLRNRTPARDLPRYVIGPWIEGQKARENWQWLNLYLPRGAGLVLGSNESGSNLESELGFVVVAKLVKIPPRDSLTFTYRFSVPAQWSPRRGRYTLLLRRQPMINADAIRMRVSPPAGWRVVGGPGRKEGRGRVVNLKLTRNTRIELELNRTIIGGIGEFFG